MKNRNVIKCNNGDGVPTIMIRNSIDFLDSQQRKSDHLLLKTNVQITVEGEELGAFHVILCKTNNVDILHHFDNIADHLFLKDDNAMSSEEILSLFSSLVAIFKLTPEKNNLQMQIGIFGELISLHYFIRNNLKKIVTLWHKDFSSCHDIELDDKNRIEIKATTNERRIHRFNHNQIYREDVNVIVLSLILESSEKGTTLFDLFQKTKSVIQDARTLIALELLEYKSGVTSFDKGFSADIDNAISSIKVFSAFDLPHLDFLEVKGVTGVAYDVDCQFADDETAEVFTKWQ